MDHQKNSTSKSIEDILIDLINDTTEKVNLKDIELLKETIKKIIVNRQTSLKNLKKMKNNWRMFAICKEAYLAQVTLYLDFLGIKNNLYEKVAIVPGTNKADKKLLIEDNDQEFVDKVFAEVEKIIDI
jgi:hypothetical protein